MGVYLNNTKQRAYLNGQKLNAYINGVRVWEPNIKKNYFEFTIMSNFSSIRFLNRWNGPVLVNGIRFEHITSSIDDALKRIDITLNLTVGSKIKIEEAEVGVFKKPVNKSEFFAYGILRFGDNVDKTLTKLRWDYMPEIEYMITNGEAPDYLLHGTLSNANVVLDMSNQLFQNYDKITKVNSDSFGEFARNVSVPNGLPSGSFNLINAYSSTHRSRVLSWGKSSSLIPKDTINGLTIFNPNDNPITLNFLDESTGVSSYIDVPRRSSFKLFKQH